MLVKVSAGSVFETLVQLTVSGSRLNDLLGAHAMACCKHLPKALPCTTVRFFLFQFLQNSMQDTAKSLFKLLQHFAERHMSNVDAATGLLILIVPVFDTCDQSDDVLVWIK